MRTFPIITLFFILTTTIYAEQNDAEKKSQDEVDFMALATLLIKDGYYQRANTTLDSVNTQEKDFDSSYYYTLRGLVAFHLKHFDQSIQYFNLSLNAGNQDKQLFIYLTQVYYLQKKYQNALDSLMLSGDLSDSSVQLLKLKIDCYWHLNEPEQAIKTLTVAYQKFPQQHDFLKQSFFYFVKLNLFQSAITMAESYLKVSDPDANTYIAMASALRKSTEFNKAIIFLEKAHLKYSTNAKLIALLAHLYIDVGKIYSAANLFQKAAIYKTRYLSESGEMYRRSKDFVLALYLNSQMLDKKQKLKQKMAIFLEFSQFDRAVAMEQDLQRSGLIKDENIRYALAYAYYKTENFKHSERHLKKLVSNEFFRKAIELRKSMVACNNDVWSCQ
jgi:tetratricopeptide (TPR) repeat protein